MLIILFGLSGSGKNFVGDILAQHFGYCFWDADELLLSEMQEQIINQKPFTQDMRDKFAKIVIDHVKNLTQKYPYLVIAQALYKEVNRKQVLAAFPEAKLILIDATDESIAKHLKKRNDNAIVKYAAMTQKNFERPTLSHEKIDNNSDEASIIKQVHKLLKSFTKK